MMLLQSEESVVWGKGLLIHQEHGQSHDIDTNPPYSMSLSLSTWHDNCPDAKVCDTIGLRRGPRSISDQLGLKKLLLLTKLI